MPRDYKNLKVFHVVDALVVSVYEATASFPKAEMCGLTSQLRRGAVSVPANIVEGAARHTDGEFAHFLNIAYGSFAEVRYFLDLALRLGFLEADVHTLLAAKADEPSRMLNGLMKSVRGA